MRWSPLAAGFTALVCACRDAPPAVSFAYDPTLEVRLTARNVAWPSACERPPSERIGLPLGLAPEAATAAVSPEFVADLAAAIEGLPQPLGRLFTRRVCAVVLMRGAPMSGTLRAIQGDPSRALIFLDVDALDRTPNAWMAFKESTPFALGEGRRIRGKLAVAGDDTRRVLLEFVLVHELAHVADWTRAGGSLIGEFERQSWPRTDELAKWPLIHYPARLKAAPLPDAKVEPYFELMATGAFASPATLSNENEDLADSVATYVHTVLLRRPWQLELYDSERLVIQLNTCWEEPRCAEKRRLIERLLQRWAEE